MKIITQIFGVLLMLNNSGMSAHSNIFISHPRHTLSNIFNILTCYRHNYIISLGNLGFTCHLWRYVFKRGGCVDAKMRINLSIMNTRHATISKIFLLKVSSSYQCCNLTKFLPFNAYGIPPPFKSLNDNNLSR